MFASWISLWLLLGLGSDIKHIKDLFFTVSNCVWFINYYIEGIWGLGTFSFPAWCFLQVETMTTACKSSWIPDTLLQYDDTMGNAKFQCQTHISNI